RIESHGADAPRRAHVEVVELGEIAGAVRDVGRAVVDEAPRRPTVGRLVEAPLRRPRNGTRDAGAADRGHAAERRRRADVEGVRRTGLDHDLADALTGELGLADRPGPRVAAVGRLVEPRPGHTAGAADVRLARADVDGVACEIVRIDRHGARRVDPERAAEVLPLDVAGERVLRPPDA